MKSIFRILVILLFLPLPSPAQDDYSFDISEIEKRPYTIGGYLELMPKVFWRDRDAAFYRLNFYDREGQDCLDEYSYTFSLNGEYEKGISKIYLRSNISGTESDIDSDTDIAVDEAYLSIKPLSTLNITIGKKVLKWGKGYAWNPVGFAGRSKNPDDPDLALEGYTVATADYIKSFSGPLKVMTVSPVLIPVYDHINTDFGIRNNMNYAGKLYLLLYDTDIDIMFLKGNSKASRIGLDFSRNITSNFEIHGEIAHIDDAMKRTIDSTGTVTQSTGDRESFLFGARYLAKTDTTFIFEYYRNGPGFTGEEMEDFFGLVENGFDAYRLSGNETLLTKARSVTEGSYGRQNPMKDYLYLRISQKDPFDILYLTPSVTCIYNTTDESFSLSPEIVYRGFTNFEIRLKSGFLIGSENSEFGEKQNDYRAELRIRYYFDANKIFQ